MRTGKLSEAVLARSVLRPLQAGDPAGCVPFAEGGQKAVYAVICAAPGFAHRPGALVTAAANRLASLGAAPESLLLHALLPRWYEESALRADMRQIAEEAGRQGMKVAGGHTEVTGRVEAPCYTATAVGRMLPEADGPAQETDVSGDASGGSGRRRFLLPGQELVLTKWIALAGTAAIAEAHEGELRGRYPAFLVDSARSFAGMMSVTEEAELAAGFGAWAMRDLSQGGIFGALWEMAEQSGVGLEVDLKRIPVRQETVEVCEYFDVNPYCLYSAGSLLIGTDRGEELAERLSASGIPAAVIGRAAGGRERILHNGGEIRYLDRPQQDEWYRRFEP